MDLEGIGCYGLEPLQLSGLWVDDGVEFADVEEISAFVLRVRSAELDCNIQINVTYILTNVSCL
jgi:hypothetical protein